MRTRSGSEALCISPRQILLRADCRTIFSEGLGESNTEGNRVKTKQG